MDWKEVLDWRQRDVVDIYPDVSAELLVREMNVSTVRPPICHSRRCYHHVNVHRDGICMIDGCGCEGLVEEAA